MLFWFVIGLIVGWNFIKQPEWVANLIEKGVRYVKDYFQK